MKPRTQKLFPYITYILVAMSKHTPRPLKCFLNLWKDVALLSSLRQCKKILFNSTTIKNSLLSVTLPEIIRVDYRILEVGGIKKRDVITERETVSIIMSRKEHVIILNRKNYN